MKIGILTYTSNFNFGTFFQAYASLCSVRRMFPGADVEMVNYNSTTKYRQMGYDGLNLRKRHIYIPYLLTHLRKQTEYRKCQKQYLEIDAAKGYFSDSYTEAAAYIRSQAYDLLVVGSDTVLNFYKWNFEKHELPIYWLPAELPMLKVMLSSSIGTDLKLSDLDEKEKAALQDSAKGFDLIGVRDPISYDFIESLDETSSGRMQTMPDPTFSLEIESEHAQAYLDRHGIDADVPLIGLDLPLSVPGLEKAVMKFKTDGYKVVSWRGGSRLMDYDFSDMNPFQWAGIFSRFSLTLTNRFHASIFSMKNMTPVIAVDYKSNRVAESGLSKTSLLLDSFGLQNRCYRNIKDIEGEDWMLDTMQSLIENPPHDEIQTALDKLGQEYYSYLQRVADLVEKSDATKAGTGQQRQG